MRGTEDPNHPLDLIESFSDDLIIHSLQIGSRGEPKRRGETPRRQHRFQQPLRFLAELRTGLALLRQAASPELQHLIASFLQCALP